MSKIKLFEDRIIRNDIGEVVVPVIEHFVSLNGEGLESGKPVMFIRLAGCNLRCDFGNGGCDTCESLLFPQDRKEVDYIYYSARELADIVKSHKLKRICLTGGEPLAREGIGEFIHELANYLGDDVRIEIETNGSISLLSVFRFVQRPKTVSLTVDYKPYSSKMNGHMMLSNWRYMDERDSIKFVVSNEEEMEDARDMILKFKPTSNIIFSPMYDKVDMEELWKFCHREDNIELDIKLQLQIHKFFFPADKKGV